jgi:glycosyltransferase involved in cell wall biosynthesis
MYKIFINYPDDTACTYYRSTLPYFNCHEELREKHGIELILSRDISLSKDADCLCFHRALNPAILLTLQRAINAGKKIVWDFDDNYFIIPQWSPAQAIMNMVGFDFLKYFMEVASTVTVSTRRLGEQLSEYIAGKTVVLPNLIQPKDYPTPSLLGRSVDLLPTTQGRGMVATHFLWAGSQTHEKDLELIVDPVKQMLDRYGEAVRFTFVGMIPQELGTICSRQITFVPGGDLRYYPNLISALRPDVALIPVVDIPFNEAKSNIKFLEMTMAGAACIASEVGDYADSINNIDRYGFLINNESSSEWLSTLNFVNENIPYTMKIWRNAYNLVISEYSWSGSQRQKWIDFYRFLAEG